MLGSEAADYREFITPGMICVAVFFLAMALTSESFITERSQVGHSGYKLINCYIYLQKY